MLLHGLPVTRPSRIAADLLGDIEDPEAVAYVVADALRAADDYPGTFADALAPYAAHIEDPEAVAYVVADALRAADDYPGTSRWMEQTRAHVHPAAGKDHKSPSHPAMQVRLP
jgi:hypothetical protein